MSKVFFTADTHFGHKRMLIERDFLDVEEMDEELIQRWNNKVSDNDTIYHLGDASFHNKKTTECILKRLNGKIHLIKGNHDRIKPSMEEYFESITSLKEYKHYNRTIVLCHYPLEVWNKAHYGSWHLHGHSHGNLRTVRPCRIDVGVDSSICEGSPISLGEVHEILKNHRYEGVDHHE